MIGGGHPEQSLRMYIVVIWAMPCHWLPVAAPMLHVVVRWMPEGLTGRGSCAIGEPFASRMMVMSDAARRPESRPSRFCSVI